MAIGSLIGNPNFTSYLSLPSLLSPQTTSMADKKFSAINPNIYASNTSGGWDFAGANYFSAPEMTTNYYSNNIPGILYNTPDKKFDAINPDLYLGGQWDFAGIPVEEYMRNHPEIYGVSPPPRSLTSPWDSAPQQQMNTYTNIYGEQFTTPQQINLSRFSSSPSGALPLYMNQDISNILATALGY